MCGIIEDPVKYAITESDDVKFIRMLCVESIALIELFVPQ